MMGDNKQFEEKLALLDQLQSACTHCGLCSEACATFQSTGWEHESPRGRLHLATQFLHGRIHPKSEVLSTFDRCLGCQACEPLCPHQVPYREVRQIVQDLRRELQAVSSSTMDRNQYGRWIVLAKRMGNRWWRYYGAKWLKHSQGSFTKNRKRPQAGQLVLVICCIQDLFQHEIIEQTFFFTERLGFSFEVDRKQPCCGAIFERLVHGGEESICYPQEQKKAASLQNKARTAFLNWMPSTTYFLAKGCQSYISKHAQALDIYTWIETILDHQKLTLYFSEPQEVYYQPYCGSEKGDQDTILRLLQRIQGLTVREILNPQACCGGYCGEMLLHPQSAQTCASSKIADLPDGAILVITSPDCWNLFKSNGVNRNLTICYPIQLLMRCANFPSKNCT